MSLRAANGSPIQVLGFVTLQITLGDVSRSVNAWVIPSLGPDQILLDTATMARFGAVLDWKRQRLNFLSSKTSIPAVHRLSSSNVAKSLHTYVAAVHTDATELDVSLSQRVDIKARHVVVVTAYTNIKPSVDTEAVIEPWFPTKPKFPFSEIPSVYEQIMVARTVTTWGAKDGSVKVQVANPSSEHVALPAGLILGSLSPVTITTVVQSSSTSVSSIAHNLPLIALQLKLIFWNH